jgi:hypothetical protein
MIEDNRVVPRSRRKFHAVQRNGVRVRSKSIVDVVREAKITMLLGGDAVDASVNRKERSSATDAAALAVVPAPPLRFLEGAVANRGPS